MKKFWEWLKQHMWWTGLIYQIKNPPRKEKRPKP